MLFVTGRIKRERLAICESCEHYVASTKSCGTLGVDALTASKVCGCFMPAKAKLKMASCPYDKWDSVLKDKDIAAVRSFLGEIKTSLTGKQQQELQRLYYLTTGTTKNFGGCGRCAKKMVEDLQRMIEDVDKGKHK